MAGRHDAVIAGGRPDGGADRGSAIGTNRAHEHFDRGFGAGSARASIISAFVMFASDDGGVVSTVIENLLLRKQKLVEELDKAQAVEERDGIEHQLEQINTALDFLDRPGPKDAR